MSATTTTTSTTGRSAWQLSRDVDAILATLEAAAAALDTDPDDAAAQAAFAAAEVAFTQWSEGDVPGKVEALAIVAGELDAKAQWYRQEAQRAAERKRALAARADKLRGMQLDLVQVYMDVEQTSGVPLTGGRMARMRVTTSKRVEVTDATALGAEYVRTTTTPDKTAIGKALKAGQQVAGAVLVLVDRTKVVIK